MRRAAFTIVIAYSLAACSRKPAPAPLALAPSRAPAGLATAAEIATVETKAEGAHGSRKNKGADVPVFVDGKQRATLRHSELPSTLVPRAANGSREARYYRISEYLTALGVPAARIRAVHVRGNGDRIASIEGEELVRQTERFVFDFMERDAGIAKTRWETTGLKNTFRIDEIRELFVFVEKPVPELDARRSCYLPACSDTVPYAEDEVAKGTRVYLDGRLVGQVKRRRLTDDLALGTDPSGTTRFALAKLLRSLGIDPLRAKGLELVSGDDVIARGALANVEPSFVLPPHRHGRVLVRVPPPWLRATADATPASNEPRDAEVTAVLVYQTTTPTQRTLITIPDVPPSEDNVLVDDG